MGFDADRGRRRPKVQLFPRPLPSRLMNSVAMPFVLLKNRSSRNVCVVPRKISMRQQSKAHISRPASSYLDNRLGYLLAARVPDLPKCASMAWTQSQTAENVHLVLLLSPTRPVLARIPDREGYPIPGLGPLYCQTVGSTAVHISTKLLPSRWRTLGCSCALPQRG